MRVVSTLFSAALLCVPAFAQLPEDAGPHPVGIRSTTFSNPGPGDATVQVRLWYPALTEGDDTEPDTAGGPYPPVLFMHGYFAPPWFYGLLNRHLASYGLVIVAVGNQDGLVMNIQRFAQDGLALVHWVADKASDPTHFLHGMIDTLPWSGVGHSNGAEALLLIQQDESVFADLALMEPRWFANPQAATFPGHVLTIAGTHDVVNPPAAHARLYYEALTSTGRNLYAQVVGAGHNGSLDFPSSIINPLPHAEQHRMHRRLVGGFLRAELFGSEDELFHLFGSGAANDPLETEGVCPDPALWVRAAGSNGFLTGFLGVPGAPLQIMASAWGAPGGGLSSRGPCLRFGTTVPGVGILEQEFPLRDALPSGAVLHIFGALGSPPALTRTALFSVP